jgi:RHS repeat-associated protein
VTYQRILSLLIDKKLPFCDLLLLSEAFVSWLAGLPTPKMVLRLPRWFVSLDGVPLGNATLGGERPDVVAAYNNSAYLHSGWTFTGSIGNTSPGTHTFSVTAYDSSGNAATLPRPDNAPTAITVTPNANVLYDAENNVISVDNGATATYFYDALNHRVKVIANGVTERYGFDIAGRRSTNWQDNSTNLDQAQYYAGSQPVAYWSSSDGNIHFVHQDWLGTVRLHTSFNGSVESAFTSLPFGDALTSSGADTNETHFAMLDHDSETSSEHATFRQYSSIQGRMFSSDPYMGSYDFSNPQSLNRYAYALNSPLSNVDPSGLTVLDGEEQTSSGGGWALDPNLVTVNPCGTDATTFCMKVHVSTPVFSLTTSLVPGFIQGARPLPSTGAPSNINCNTKLPNGQTVGSYVRAGRAALASSLLNGSAVDAGLAAGGVSSNFGAAYGGLSGMLSIAKGGGPIDFKTTFAGQASRQTLGDAGNFAYYAIGSGLLSNTVLDLGAGAYGLYGAAVGRFPTSFLTGRFFSDDSARQMRGPGLAAQGCKAQ